VTEERMTMNLRRFATKRTAAIGAVVLVVAVGAGAALAATSGVFDPKAEQDAFQAAVAKKLGVTPTQLQDAYKAAAVERLDAAVAAGRITKAQADELRTRIESGDFMAPHGFMGGPGMHGPGHLSVAADYLGLTVSALAEKLQAGQSLADVAKAQGKSVDGLKQALIADEKKELGQAVADGRLTAAQRDAMLAGIEARIDDMVNRTGPPDHGRRFGFRFGGDPMNGSWSPPDA
jgi:hypothetical protein